MDKIIVFVVYGGRWDANNKYVDHQVKIIMVQEGISYTNLIEKIYKELGLDPTINSIKMSFDPKIGTSKGMTIENDDNVAVFVYLIKNDPEFKRCPLIVEIEEDSQSTTKSKTTSNQTRSTVKEKEISAVNEESGIYGKSTPCSSTRGTATTTTSSAIPVLGSSSSSALGSAASATSSSQGIIAEGGTISLGNGLDKCNRRILKLKRKYYPRFVLLSYGGASRLNF